MGVDDKLTAGSEDWDLAAPAWHRSADRLALRMLLKRLLRTVVYNCSLSRTFSRPLDTRQRQKGFSSYPPVPALAQSANEDHEANETASSSFVSPKDSSNIPLENDCRQQDALPARWRR
ncbi:hypothetical protein TESG_02257 [Trichophyton tonsurans CBS 112818]|uniref:Uncharacterized protein n=1 Tax=Trichophyton tonsurans (strain CBS 112818) TaxID=647933 RepID=F2RTV3_TRIT1|nr:hypothetical protein TESG_02257 [Trichophyton tonsurans CBS 112818]